MLISTLAMLSALPLSKDSIDARSSRFSSNRSASFTSIRPRWSAVTFLQDVSKVLRATETAWSTSFSVASWTEQIGFSVEGLIVSKVLPSWPLTNSLLMKLQSWGSACSLEYLVGAARYRRIRCGVEAEDGDESPLPTVLCSTEIEDERETHSPVGCSNLPVEGVSRVTETDMLGMGLWCSWWMYEGWECVGSDNSGTANDCTGLRMEEEGLQVCKI